MQETTTPVSTECHRLPLPLRPSWRWSWRGGRRWKRKRKWRRGEGRGRGGGGGGGRGGGGINGAPEISSTNSCVVTMTLYSFPLSYGSYSQTMVSAALVAPMAHLELESCPNTLHTSSTHACKKCLYFHAPYASCLKLQSNPKSLVKLGL